MAFHGLCADVVAFSSNLSHLSHSTSTSLPAPNPNLLATEPNSDISPLHIQSTRQDLQTLLSLLGQSLLKVEEQRIAGELLECLLEGVDSVLEVVRGRTGRLGEDTGVGNNEQFYEGSGGRVEAGTQGINGHGRGDTFTSIGKERLVPPDSNGNRPGLEEDETKDPICNLCTRTMTRARPLVMELSRRAAEDHVREYLRTIRQVREAIQVRTAMDTSSATTANPAGQDEWERVFVILMGARNSRSNNLETAIFLSLMNGQGQGQEHVQGYEDGEGEGEQPKSGRESAESTRLRTVASARQRHQCAAARLAQEQVNHLSSPPKRTFPPNQRTTTPTSPPQSALTDNPDQCPLNLTGTLSTDSDPNDSNDPTNPLLNERIFYLENVFDPEQALKTFATIEADRLLAKSVFGKGQMKRLERDVLESASLRLIGHTFH
ncbi:hypothetical protein HK102_007526 [Quaeritorhiza haematococci]|nr:hypothetical protein HK102_007526 [Quaeritorhiza haematococci]